MVNLKRILLIDEIKKKNYQDIRPKLLFILMWLWLDVFPLKRRPFTVLNFTFVISVHRVVKSIFLYRAPVSNDHSFSIFPNGWMRLNDFSL